MVMSLKHEMKPDRTPDEIARARFVSGLRGFILNDLASDMRAAYDARVAPGFAKAKGRAPANSNEVHKAMRSDPAFKVYSACRVQAQRMVWSSVIPGVERDRPKLEQLAAAKGGATVELNPEIGLPRNVTAIDVHLMPGGYAGGEGAGPGAIYDRGLAIFSMGLMGANLDDIGLSMSGYIKNRFPDFAPKAILDVGCTVGHNTLPWKQTYPEADVHAVDVAGPGLVYGAARANLQGVDVRFRQMNAESLDYPDQSFDLVFTSMFLHELSAKTRAAFFKEARRVLRPGGLLLNMELPPNNQMGAFEGFYLDWDCWYNEEPFYKGYRDEDPAQLCRSAGFRDEDYLQFVVPSVGIYGAEAVAEAAHSDPLDVNRETTGRLAAGVQWFGFGAWKQD
jgi:ubiquinone/menaquinone biosynthesis C-methylase UbiE